MIIELEIAYVIKESRIFSSIANREQLVEFLNNTATHSADAELIRGLRDKTSYTGHLNQRLNSVIGELNRGHFVSGMSLAHDEVVPVLQIYCNSVLNHTAGDTHLKLWDSASGPMLDNLNKLEDMELAEYQRFKESLDEVLQV